MMLRVLRRAKMNTFIGSRICALELLPASPIVLTAAALAIHIDTNANANANAYKYHEQAKDLDLNFW